MRAAFLPLAFVFWTSSVLSPVLAAEPTELLRELKDQWQCTIEREGNSPDGAIVTMRFKCTSTVPDSVMGELAAFPQLRALWLIGGQQLTNRGVAQISKLTEVETLYLRSPLVNSDGLAHLARLPKLKTLHITRLELNEEGAKAIAACSALESLHVSEAKVSPEAVVVLQGMQQLKEIHGFRNKGSLTSLEATRRAFPGKIVRIND